MKRSQDRILTTHVGSLPRPKEMLELSASRSGPPKDMDQYREVVRRCIVDIVKKQAAVGIDIVNEGEFSKDNWANYVLKRMDGFFLRPAPRRSGNPPRPWPA